MAVAARLISSPGFREQASRFEWMSRDSRYDILFASRARNVIRNLVGGEIKLVPTKASGLEAHLQGDDAGLIELAKENPGTKAGASKVSLVAGIRSQRYLQTLVSRIPMLNHLS
jgi:hypothetical protein